jgi:putative toxin-antitoxin system antitoxin component (TIGR02293 family)
LTKTVKTGTGFPGSPWYENNHFDALKGVVFGVVPSEIFENRQNFIEVARAGIPGAWVKGLIDATGLRDTFVTILGVTSSNLSRIYKRKALNREDSEEVLDTVRLLRQAAQVWESQGAAMQWLKSEVPALGGVRPISLFDTFEGRRWASQVLRKIEYGDFS